jgi:hypothetical protein
MMGHEWGNEETLRLFNVVDTYSKYLFVFAIPLAKQDGEYQVTGLTRSSAPAPGRGRGPQAKSDSLGWWTQQTALKRHDNLELNPQSNRAIEGAKRTLKQTLTSYSDAKRTKKWWFSKEILNQVLAVLDTSYHRNLGMGRSPYSVLTAKSLLKDRSNILKTQEFDAITGGM